MKRGTCVTKTKYPCELALASGLVLTALSVCLFLRSGLGVTVISSVPLMLHYTFPFIDFGVWNMIFNAAMLVLAVVLLKRARASYIVSLFMAVIYGALIDLFKPVVFMLPISLPLSILYFLLSMLALSVGIAFYMKCRLPLLPCDVFIRDAVIAYRIPYRKVKTIFDISCLAVSLVFCFAVLGELRDIGIGTVVSAITTGSCVAFFMRRMDSAFEFEPAIPAVGRFVNRDEAISKR